jgi:predicted kinase
LRRINEEPCLLRIEDLAEKHTLESKNASKMLALQRQSTMLSRTYYTRGVSFCQEIWKTKSKKCSRLFRRENSGTRKPFIEDNLPMERSGTGSRLIIVCGLPGSGKTTLAKALESRLRAVRFSPDEWMDALSLNLWDEERRAKIEALQWKFAQELLALGLTVIIEWGTWGRAERDTLRLAARALGAAVELHYVSAPVDVLFERIQRRGMEKPPIERDAVSRWFEMFQAPTPEEMALFDKPLVADFASG